MTEAEVEAGIGAMAEEGGKKAAVGEVGEAGDIGEAGSKATSEVIVN